MQMPAFSPAQISESRAEASGMLSRQPRLETREAPGGASQQPYHPHMLPQAPMLGGDMGVYVKWALLLQEQLDHVSTERTKLEQHVTQLQIENQQLRMVRTRASPLYQPISIEAVLRFNQFAACPCSGRRCRGRMRRPPPSRAAALYQLARPSRRRPPARRARRVRRAHRAHWR